MININDCLPTEILEVILKKLPEKSETCACRLVCRRWKFIIDELVGHDMTVTNYKPIMPLLEDENERVQITKDVKEISALERDPSVAIRNLSIGRSGMLISEELTPLIRDITGQLPQFPKLAFPHVLQSLSCFEPLPTNLFSALDCTVNLTDLEISLFSFSSLNESSFDKIITFRSLSKLTVSDTPTFPDFDCTKVTPSLKQFLEKLNAPLLSTVDLSYPVTSLLTVADDCTRDVVKFLKRLRNLKNLIIAVCSPNQNISPPQKNFHYPTELLMEMETFGQTLQVQSMYLKDNHLHSLRPSVQTKAWIVFLKQQMRLQTLRFYLKSSIEFEPDVGTAIYNNLNSLKKLELSCFPCEIQSEDGYVSFIAIDCKVFKDCVHLETLKLADKTMNTMQLPKCLSNIYIDAMLTNGDAHCLLVSDFPNMKMIELKDSRGGAPKGLGYGVTVQSLCEFVKRRVVKRLVIYAGSTDQKFPSDGIPNEDVERPQLLRKKRGSGAAVPYYEGKMAVNLVRIDWQLNERGFYQEGEYMRQRPDDLNHCLYKCNSLFFAFV